MDRIPDSMRSCAMGDQILREWDLKVGQSRLWAKVLVFPTRNKMRRYWHWRFPYSGGICSKTRAVVHDPTQHVWQFTDGAEKEFTRRDPKYFCVAGFVHGDTPLHVVAHEAVHMAFAYAERVKGRKKWPGDPEQEAVCYPAGDLTAALWKMFGN